MTDVLFVAIIIVFFALMVAFVRLCERIVGRGDVLDIGSEDDQVEASDRPDGGGPEDRISDRIHDHGVDTENKAVSV